MNAPFEPYRVILDYEALQDGFLDRIEDLNTTMDQIDAAAGFTRGHTQKLLHKGGTNKWARRFAGESLGKMLKGTGLVIVLALDDERFADVRGQLVARKRPIKPANASSARPAWLFTKKKAREMGTKRWSVMTPAQRKKLARKAGKASGKARRRKAKRDGALLIDAARAQSLHGQIAPTRERQMVLGQAKTEAQIVASHADAARGAAIARSGQDIPPPIRRDAAG